MHGRFQHARAVPEGFVVVSVQSVGDDVQIMHGSKGSSGGCPACGLPSQRVQSRYVRRRRISHLQSVVRWCRLLGQFGG